MDRLDDNDDNLSALLDKYVEGALTAAECEDLSARLRASAQARRTFWEYVQAHALLQMGGRAARWRDGDRNVAAPERLMGSVDTVSGKRGLAPGPGRWNGHSAAACLQRPLNTKERGFWSHVPQKAWFQHK